MTDTESIELRSQAAQDAGHVPVLFDEVMTYLQPRPGRTYVDATLGAGGHSTEILKAIAATGALCGGRLIVFEQDLDVLNETHERLQQRFPELFSIESQERSRLVLVPKNFSTLYDSLACEPSAIPLDGGLLADLGVSSMQLDRGERGFSFRKEAPLDMRMNPSEGMTAEEVVNTYPETRLVQIFSEFGEERFSKTIARDIVAARKVTPFKTTIELAELVRKVYGRIKIGKNGSGGRSRLHPATRVFQAIRIEVNQELASLEALLAQLPQSLAPGARAVLISFHSLEDRIVKRAFRRMSRWDYDTNQPPSFKLLTLKPIMANEEELKRNPRARSAKLRAVERVSEPE